jgi:hypothetical protein
LNIDFLLETNWSFLIIRTISMPVNVLLADSNSLKPKPSVILFFINLWSCSTMLFKYIYIVLF